MKRFLTCFLAAVMLLSAFPSAYGEENMNIKIESGASSGTTENGGNFTEVNGKADISVVIDNATGSDAYLYHIQPTTGAADNAVSSASFTPNVSSNTLKVFNGKNPLNFTVDIANNNSTTGNVTLRLYYIKAEDAGKSSSFTIDLDYKFTINRTTPASVDPNGGEQPRQPEAPDETPKEDSEFCLRTSNKDANGICVPTPSGDYGDEIEVRLPLVCTRGSVYDIQVSPVLNTDIEKFPFDINLVDYTLSYPNSIGQDQVVEFRYLWRLSKKATMGVKQVDFNVSYRTGFGGEKKTGTVSLFVNVRKGLTPQTGDATASVPKLIIESYTLSPEKIYAGETFGLEFTVRNTSSSETIKNIQIKIKDAAETATIVPASGGSNTIYISKISKGDTDTQKLSFQTAPDAEAKAYTLNLDFSYESASTNTPHEASESIAVPILQKIRLKCDEPVIYDEMAWVGSSCSMYVKMYNMGRSTIYNCMVDVEGQGLKMEESYFGGNLTGGSTLSADFSILPSVAGNIEGSIIISYEDVYGEPGQEKLPFTLLVEEQAAMDDPMMAEGMMEETGPEPKGMPWWGWVLILGGLGTGGFFGVRELRRRRARSLEEDI